jgi:molybdopterin/thiamine biosynthesis adenylyltransferase
LQDQHLLRYSRQIMLPEFDYIGQASLLKTRILIVGLGGLGCPVALYLAAAGIGELVLVDDDQVDKTNLQRQIAHTEAAVDTPKAISAATAIKRINSDTKVSSIVCRLEGDLLYQQVKQADLVMDCSDNITTRVALNKACIKERKPWVSGAAVRFEGHVTVFDPRQPESPCYQCLYGTIREVSFTCTDNGVIGPLVGIIGSTQALEAVKLLTEVGEPLIGRLLLLDGKAMQWRSFALPRNPKCLGCAGMT